MVNFEKKSETVGGTPNAPNQSSTGTDTVIIPLFNPNFEAGELVSKLQSSSLSDNRHETNAVNKHRHHHDKSLDVVSLENSLSSKLQLNNSNAENLNEYCLLEIFSYLSFEDMMQVKDVCKKWNEVSQQWFKKIQTLVYDHDGMGYAKLELYEKYYKHKIYETTEICPFKNLFLILRTCGHYIEYYKVTIKKENNPIDIYLKFILPWVPILCKNIVDVEIHGGKLDIPFIFVIMAAHWKKLERIYIQYLPRSVENDFLKLLHNNKRLKTLTLYFASKTLLPVNYKFFAHLSTTIKKIIIGNKSINETEQLSHFISVSKNFTSLQSLELSRFRCLTDALVEAIADIKSLTHLSFHHVYYHESQKTIDSIANIKGLKSLCLAHNRYLDEDSFIKVVESCIELEQLDISNGMWLTKKGMAAIAKLKKLKCLKINAEYMTAECVIGSCHSLEVLQCYGWKIKKNNVVEVLKTATNLRLLDIAGVNFFSYPTVDVLQAAYEIANERKNNILCVTGFFGFDLIGLMKTPYFKYSMSVQNLPLEIFPEDIRCYIEQIINM